MGVRVGGLAGDVSPLNPWTNGSVLSAEVKMLAWFKLLRVPLYPEVGLLQ